MTRFKTITLYVTLAVVTVVAIFGISGLERSIERDIKNYHLRFTGEIKNAPGWISFTTVALGSFRGLLADVLWLHQMSLKDQGSYYEMVQLANWITDLQPQVAGSAVYLGWEMAYNLSVTCANYEDRWRWIAKGTSLLRDKAMLYNPEDTSIYLDLARIYGEKFGNVFDDAHLYYKNKLYLEASRAMGFKAKQKPDWEAMAKVVPDFLLTDWDTSKGFNEHFPEKSPARGLIASAGYSDFAALLGAYQKADGLPVGKLDNLSPADREWLNNYLRAAWIWQSFRLNPHLVVKINQDYGDLDWRTPEALAIYWAVLGQGYRPPNQTRRQFDNRIHIALQETFRNGRPLLTDPENKKYFIGVPNFSVLDRTLRAAEEGYKNNQDDETFTNSRIYFLRDAVLLLYSYGQTKRAGEMFDLLKQYDPGQDKNETLKHYYDRALQEKINFATVKSIGELLVGTIYCELHYLVYGDNARATELAGFAEKIYNKFIEDNTERKSGADLPPLDVLIGAVVDNYLKSAPPELADRLRRIIEQQQAVKRQAEKERASAPNPVK